MITCDNTKTIYDLINRAGEEFQDRIYLRYEDQGAVFDVSYEQFTMECEAVMAWIQEQNLRYGHTVKVGLMGSSSHQYLVMLLGTMAAGAVAVPLDVQLSLDTFSDNLNRSEVDVVFYDHVHEPLVKDTFSRCPKLKEAYSFQNAWHEPCFDEVMSEYIGCKPDPEKLKIDDPAKKLAMILFTSGTTGRGKGVMLSQQNLVDNIFCTTDQGHPEKEVYLNILPIHHVFCINGDVLIVMRYGSTLCLNRDMAKLAAHIQLFQPSVIRMVPMVAKTLYNRIALMKRQDPERPITSVRTEVLGGQLHKLICGGGYLDPELAANFRNIGISIAQGYGMSECSPKIAAPDWNRTDKVASVGKIVDRCEVRIVDGEIQAKSPSVMMGYYGEPEKTAEAITEDGWLRTGDIGYVDDEGFLYLTGRKKNLIILSNGENVAPEQIERMFADDRLVDEILVYGEDDVITAEIYPNFKYAEAAGIKDLETVLNEIVKKHNNELESYKRIMRVRFREVPFPKTSSKKIIRSQYFSQKKKEEEELANVKAPENELQSRIYEAVAAVLGHRRFGIDTDFYEAGLDSMGSVLLLTDLHDHLKIDLTLSELMEHASIEKLEAFSKEKSDKPQVDYTKREVYPLTGLQQYFAYVMRGNTTANLPFLYKLDPSIDLTRLKAAIEQLLNVHPELKDIIQPDGGIYKNFRHDEARVEIPVRTLSDPEWKITRKNLVQPYMYTEGEPLYHIAIYRTESANYLFFDVAHIMGDGMTMNILIEDLNKLYLGENVAPEEYTFYEYILDEKAREEQGLRAKYIEYFTELMKDCRIRRSILTRKNCYDLEHGYNAQIKKRLPDLNMKEVKAFCRQSGVSENVLFLTAFNYCISLFSNTEDTISSSIHSGRTDSRWNRLAGPLFLTYMFRCKTVAHEKTTDLLRRCGRQIMETMQCHISTLHADEMFFQYQGDILELNEIGGMPAERQTITLDSLPFHLQIMSDPKGYYYILRFWENRFDEKQLKIFMTCYETIISAMLTEPSARRLKYHLSETLYPLHYTVTAGELNREAGCDLLTDTSDDQQVKVYVFNRECRKQPFGAWGELFVLDHPTGGYTDMIKNPYGSGTLYNTGRTARILPDGTIDFLEQGGRTVLQEGVRGRNYLNLKKLETVLAGLSGVETAEAGICYGGNNQMLLYAELGVSDDSVDESAVQNAAREALGEAHVPQLIQITKIH
jgi:long-subunit acyl-CoA synthetase (AMP-forming)